MINKFEILIVDDVKDNLLALNALLEREDVSIFQAQSGTAALDLMLKHDFCLALIDVQMPAMSGFELAELMRGANRTKYIPIIFVTATAKAQSFLFKGYESGAVDFLFKPLDAYAVNGKVNVFIELFKQKTELEKIQSELKQAIMIRDDFMSIASHELKTPLTSLMLQSQMRKRELKKGEFTNFTSERLTKIFDTDERQLQRITRLIDDMLDVSRISSGKLSMNLEKFDLCELVQDVVERSSEQFVAAGCPVKVEVCPPLVGHWDRFRIEQVVTNLLTNAIRYGAGKPILARVSAHHDRAQIDVSDEGSGIAEENYDRIFQKFERTESKSGPDGLGLGLYIVKQIIKAHHGSIRVESEIGLGSTFSMDLPLTPLV